MIAKILVPFDGSEPANRAIDLSLYLADKCSAEILVLSVVKPIIIPPYTRTYPQQIGITPIPPTPPLETDSLERRKSNYQNLLSNALDKAKKTNPNLKISTKLEEGQPSDKILEIAKDGNFDMVVMGSTGIGGIKELFLGSVSNKVVNEAKCPVLIVK